jgi:DNA-binding NarL/FixJ family response regulator
MSKKVAIVDDHEFFRGGLKMALKRNREFEVVIEAENGRVFLEKMKNTHIDIVLMDIKMPVMDGFETTVEAKKLYPNLKILILSMFNYDEYIQKLLEAGVDGFILKNINKDDLETALKYVVDGQQYFSNELMPFFTRQVLNKTTKEETDAQLTPRELEVLKLVYEGFSNKEIADKLFISVRTVTNHRASLNLKTGSKNTASLISYAIKNKLVQ